MLARPKRLLAAFGVDELCNRRECFDLILFDLVLFYVFAKFCKEGWGRGQTSSMLLQDRQKNMFMCTSSSDLSIYDEEI